MLEDSHPIRFDITSLFEHAALFPDANGDGYGDDVELSVPVDKGLSDPFVWAGILNLAARLSFEVTGLSLPLVKKGGLQQGSSPQLIVERLRGDRQTRCEDPPRATLCRLSEKTLSVSGSSGRVVMKFLNLLAAGTEIQLTEIPRDWKTIHLIECNTSVLAIEDNLGNLIAECPLEPTAFPIAREDRLPQGERTSAHPDLLNPTGPRGFYRQRPDLPRRQELAAGIALDPAGLSFEVGSALAGLVCRLCLETTDLRLPLAIVGKPSGRDLVLSVREEPVNGAEIRWSNRKRDANRVMVAAGESRALAELLRRWSEEAFVESGPGCEAIDALRSHVAGFLDLLAGRTLWGKWAHYLTVQKRFSALSCATNPASLARIEKACRALSLPQPVRIPSPKPVRRSKRWMGETEEIISRVKLIAPGSGPLSGEIFVSKPKARRRQLKDLLEGILVQKGYSPRLVVLNAYKAGFCWLHEEILPNLQSAPTVSELELHYQPFAAAAAEALEVRSRWLQEAFPAPDLLARSLGLGIDRIRVSENPRLKTTYRVAARDGMGDLILQESLQVRWTRLPYLKTDPTCGFIHPATGGIRLWHPGGVLLDQNIATDRERFWRTFQNVWLGLLEEQMESRLQRESCEGQTAFWKEIRVQIRIEETDERLGLGEERVCPMEALHEDIYFVLLDAFSSFARLHGLPDSLQLGRIVPLVSAEKRDAGPEASITLAPMPWPQAPRVREKLPVTEPAVTALRFKRGFWSVKVGGVEQLTAEQLTRLATIAGAWGFAAWERDGEMWLRGKKPKQESVATSSPPGPPPMNRLLAAKEVEDWLNGLRELPHLRTWTAARSLFGRPVTALEAVLPGQGELLSTARSRLLRPTLLFNARHHANEISSTAATLCMAWFVATTQRGREWLRHVNVVWIPLENVDGVATFEQIQPATPDHKLHAARYNAVGAEYYSDYFEDPPRFPEARAKTRLWQRWQPYLMVDHHGFPSHEWDQPFSGGIAPRFREFWIPRTLVYAIVPFIDDPSHPLHAHAVELSGLLERAMGMEEEIVAVSRELAERYHRYTELPEKHTSPALSGISAHKADLETGELAPDSPSPQVRSDPMPVLPVLPRLSNINYAVRHPQVTRSEIVIEVADEVVSGKWLELCTRAHYKVEEALIESARPSGRFTVAARTEGGDCVWLSWCEDGRKPGVPGESP